jgi:hypothetical protein
MKSFEINSEEATFLRQLQENKIIVREVHVVDGVGTDLVNPIQVITELPTGEGYSYFFNPFSFYLNIPGATNKTNRKMEFVVSYCKYTKLIISSTLAKKIKFRLLYDSVGGEKITILLNKDLDGYTFSLTPQSNEIILSKFKDARPVRNVFVGYDVKANFELYHGKIKEHIIPALTDLTLDQINQLGGAKIIDIKTNHEILDI